jgi:hypothetical protein
MSDDFFLILFLRPPVFDDQIDCWMQQFFGLRRYVISFQYTGCVCLNFIFEYLRYFKLLLNDI